MADCIVQGTTLDASSARTLLYETLRELSRREKVVPKEHHEMLSAENLFFDGRRVHISSVDDMEHVRSDTVKIDQYALAKIVIASLPRSRPLKKQDVSNLKVDKALKRYLKKLQKGSFTTHAEAIEARPALGKKFLFIF